MPSEQETISAVIDKAMRDAARVNPRLFDWLRSEKASSDEDALSRLWLGLGPGLQHGHLLKAASGDTALVDGATAFLNRSEDGGGN